MLAEMKRGSIRYTNGLDYGLIAAELWPEQNKVRERIFTEAKVDTEVSLEYLDVPFVHCYQEKIGDEFFDALANSPNIELFRYRSI
jgi:hypothetical protein